MVYFLLISLRVKFHFISLLCSAWYMAEKDFSLVLIFLTVNLCCLLKFLSSKRFWSLCVLRDGPHLHTHFCLQMIGGIIKEVRINTNTWHLASNGLMFTKEKQEVEGFMQFMGGGKQLGRSFDVRTVWCIQSQHLLYSNINCYITV